MVNTHPHTERYHYHGVRVMPSPDEAFLAAISTIKKLSKGPNALNRPSNDRKVQLYGLYKQSTEGNVEGIMPRPVGQDPQARAGQQKWDAWKSYEGIPKPEAKLQYVEYLLETMRLSAPDRTDRPWQHLEETLRLARESGMSQSPPNVSLGSAYPSGTVKPLVNSERRRRLSVGSLNSSYSHIMRNTGGRSPSVRNFSTFSEFGLSERDRSERHADQIVDQLQSAYPPVIPGAVVNFTYGSDHRAAQPLWYQNGSRYPPISDESPVADEPDSEIRFRVRQWLVGMANVTNQLLENLLKLVLTDAAKLFAILLITRFIVSRPKLLQNSPVLRRCIQTVGRLTAVLLNAFDIELQVRGTRRLAAFNG